MFLGRYDFAGDPEILASCYDAMIQHVPAENLPFHACIQHAGGLTIYDCCPSAEVFRDFSTSPEFLDLVRQVGLPEPEVTPLGEVHAARTGDTRIV